MSKHTPGPWEAREHSDGSHWFVDWDGGWTAGDELSEANARLIAAAPDLLNALEESLVVISFSDFHEDQVPAANEVMRRIRAAIAKARGKSIARIALRWSIQQGNIIPIPRSSNPQRIAENLQVFDFASKASTVV